MIGPNSALPNEVAIYFKDKRVPLVTKSIVVLWNSGNTTLLGTHATDHDPLFLSAPSGTEILDARLDIVTRDVNAFKIDFDTKSNRIACRFDFLDPKDGAVIIALHTGEADLNLSGTFRGMPTGLSNRGRMQFQERLTPFRRMLRISKFVLTFILLLVGSLLLYAAIVLRPTDWLDLFTKLFGMAMGIAFTLPFLYLAYDLFKKRRLPSKKLNVEDEVVT
jgi:uncharacterized membrane protein SirB2